jgi:hypothetical protein
MAAKHATFSINRAPVLTLWAVVAGLNARAKGRRLGGFTSDREKPKKGRGRGGRTLVEVCGRTVPVTSTTEGVRAVAAYLENAFGEALVATQGAMRRLARAYPPAELARRAYALYERFRPAVPEGKKGWGARGTLDLGQIGRLADQGD